MPGLDNTGPLGEGARTGRRKGRCNRDLGSGNISSGPRQGIAGKITTENSQNLFGAGKGIRREPGITTGRGWRFLRGK